MIDMQAIKDRHPDSQVNALGSKDMQDIRTLIAECERLTKEVTERRDQVDEYQQMLDEIVVALGSLAMTHPEIVTAVEKLKAANGELWDQQCETAEKNDLLTAEGARKDAELEILCGVKEAARDVWAKLHHTEDMDALAAALTTASEFDDTADSGSPTTNEKPVTTDIGTSEVTISRLTAEVGRLRSAGQAVVDMYLTKPFSVVSPPSEIEQVRRLVEALGIDTPKDENRIVKWVRYNPRAVLPKARKDCLVRVAARERPHCRLPVTVAVGYGKWGSNGHYWVVPGVGGPVTHYSDCLDGDELLRANQLTDYRGEQERPSD